MSLSRSLTNSSAETVATTGLGLGASPSNLIAVPISEKSMLSSTGDLIVFILTSTTALAPPAAASAWRRSTALFQPSLCPRLQDQPRCSQQVAETVDIGFNPCERSASISAGVRVAIQG